jgi:hypothetical protein
MRKSLSILAVVVPLLGLGAFAAAAVPAFADNDDDEIACISGPALLPSGPIELEALPAQQVTTGPLSVRGLGCDDEDDDHGGSRGDDDGDDD